MNNFNKTLTDILKKDLRFLDQDGDLLKSEVIDKAWKVDKALIETLLSEKQVKDKFFTEIEKHWVFNVALFVEFVQDKNFLNDSYTKFKNKIGLTVDGKYLNQRGEVALAFPYKDCVLEGGQSNEDTGRDEIFFNEILAQDEIDRLLDPKVFTNWKRFSEKGEEKVKEIKRDENGLIKENLIIKGNNLLALHSLKKQFSGKVKLIYIDPPYNTGKDSFRYNDRFNHSTWLTFMKNRLEVAKELLKEDGILVVQADDKEQAYLKVLLDGIFGKDNFQTSFYVQVRYGNKTLSEDNDFQKVMEIAHVYSKDANTFAPNKLKEEYSLAKFEWGITELEKGEIVEINGKKVEIFKDGQYKLEKIKPNIDGLKETWATGSLIRQGGTAAEFLSKYLIERKKKDGLCVMYKVYGMGKDGLGHRYILGPKKKEAFRGKFYSGVPMSIREGVISGEYAKEKSIPNFIYNYLQFEGDFGNCRHEGGVDIGGGKKPEKLISYFIEYFSDKGDIVLDYHLGSGTTAAVAHKMGRQYIGVEQMDYIETKSSKRIQNVINGDETGISKSVEWKGGGDFVYLELKKYNEAFIDRIQNAKNTKELEKIWAEMKEKSFLNWNVDFRNADLAFEEWAKLDLEKQQHALVQLLNKNQLYVNMSEIDDISSI